MKKKCNSNRKNGRFTAHAIFATAICLCMLFAACKDDPPPPNPPSFGNEGTAVTLSPTAMGSVGAPIPLSTSVTADSLAWTCTKYTPASGVITPYALSEVTALISNAGTKNASVTVKKAGTYEFTLTANNTGSTAVTKTVTVVVNGYEYTATLNGVTANFSASFSPDTSINFATTSYTAPDNDWKEFSTSEITYTVEDNSVPSKVKDGKTGFTVNISDGPYANFTTPVFTQIFEQNDVEVGRQVISVSVTGGRFQLLKDVSGTNLDPQAIPSVTLNLSKLV